MRRSADAIARGLDAADDLPPALRPDVAAWVGELRRRGQELDRERSWIGLLTLACLHAVSAPPAVDAGKRGL